ncbi:VOC family protein [Nocardioides bruguierae]|uniref:VOC family protein n=1 Tax=Nocardioides bruguierae TaxID=2945102 RepID=A0A9X2IFM7_9ACTN|nr:VOC family protein [Nocardioides bruguierae]MCM0621996.1 VOC family protein [Nocardioides bruguierae]
MPTPTLAAINLECPDPAPLAAFWARLLDGTVVLETPDYCAVSAAGLVLGAARVEGYRPPTWPSNDRSQQVHLDLRVDDLDGAERDALALGATKEDHQPSPERSRVLRDPAGHPFCLRA